MKQLRIVRLLSRDIAGWHQALIRLWGRGVVAVVKGVCHYRVVLLLMVVLLMLLEYGGGQCWSCKLL